MINIKKCIDDAELGKSNLSDSILKMNGMSSPKVRHLLNNLCAKTNLYLEIGCYTGSTLISAAFGNSTKILAVDDFSEFDNGGNYNALLNNIGKYIPNNDVNFFNSDFRKLSEFKDFLYSGIEVYFYDGNHAENFQYDALDKMQRYLSDEFVYIVDDWNYPPVPIGTNRAIKDLKLQILEEYTLPARFNGDKEMWWNGLYIVRLKK